MVYYTNNLIGTSDDRIKSYERDIVGATETLNKLTPKIYDKHPFFKVDSEIDGTDLSAVEILLKRVRINRSRSNERFTRVRTFSYKTK